MMTTNPMPKAKTERLIVQVIDDETLVYDMGRHAATCLNEFAARVWRQCDGTTSVADIADALGEDERAVWLALHKLNKSKLLVQEIALPPDMRAGKTRREIAKQLGLGAAVAAASSIVVPMPAQAASCLPSGSRCTLFGTECCAGATCSDLFRGFGTCETF
jgi:Coenzyme PQQ synthesis protein D (PqqD)